MSVLDDGSTLKEAQRAVEEATEAIEAASAGHARPGLLEARRKLRAAEDCLARVRTTLGREARGMRPDAGRGIEDPSG